MDSLPPENKSEHERKLGVAEAAGGIIFVGIGCAFTEYEFHFWALLSYWVSVAFGIDVVVRYMGWPKKTWFYLMAVSAVTFLLIASCHVPTTLTFKVCVNGHTEDSISLTNDFLKFAVTRPEVSMSTTKVSGFLVIPVVTNATNIRVEIGASGSRAISDLILKAILSTNFSVTYSSNVWQEHRIRNSAHERELEANIGGIGPEIEKSAELNFNVENWALASGPNFVNLTAGTPLFENSEFLAFWLVFCKLPITNEDLLPQPIVMQSNFKRNGGFSLTLTGQESSNGVWTIRPTDNFFITAPQNP